MRLFSPMMMGPSSAWINALGWITVRAPMLLNKTCIKVLEKQSLHYLMSPMRVLSLQTMAPGAMLRFGFTELEEELISRRRVKFKT